MFKREQDKLSLIPHQWVKDQIVRVLSFSDFRCNHAHIEQAKGDYVESFTSRMLKPEGSDGMKAIDPEEDDIIMHLASGLYAGAADTVSRNSSLKGLGLTETDLR